MMDLGGWLRSLGLEQYEAAFRKNAIDDTVLPSLTPGGSEGFGRCCWVTLGRTCPRSSGMRQKKMRKCVRRRSGPPDRSSFVFAA
jgi:hypothetical protein